MSNPNENTSSSILEHLYQAEYFLSEALERLSDDDLWKAHKGLCAAIGELNGTNRVISKAASDMRALPKLFEGKSHA